MHRRPPSGEVSAGYTGERGAEAVYLGSNARLRASGYTFVHPTYRDGYGALLAAGEGATPG